MSNYIMKHEMLSEGDRVLAAVSGGADSMCMLDLLIRFCGEHGMKLGVVHVDHGFRSESASEAAYVESFCRERDIPFFLEKIEPGSIPKSEEAARIRRYELISEVSSKNGYTCTALAHNMRDRAETILFNIFRGTGLTGLTGIRPVRDEFIRPIMCLDRSEIEAYLETAGISFCTDQTNLEDDYSRNRIRHHILPEAEMINDGSLRHMNDMAEDVSGVCDLISQLASEAYQDVVRAGSAGEYSIDISRFSGLHPVIRGEVIRMILHHMTPHLKDISREHISGVEDLAFRDSNGRFDLPYGIRAYRSYETICVRKDPEGDSSAEGAIIGIPEKGLRIDLTGLTPGGEPMIIRMDESRELVFSLTEVLSAEAKSGMTSGSDYAKCFDYDKINKLLDLRFRREDDHLIIDAEGHSKKLSRYMIESKIPEFMRDRIPVIADGTDIIWIAGYRDSYAYRIEDSTTRILKIQIADSNTKGEKDG
ncbi:MAG: tRNA lysidine(34) synthetase TilS [Lachnospiraceae bacterium]|nr:tRNA lysidine(34) synthetase TilS [Lachnospiraceae bacterium]